MDLSSVPEALRRAEAAFWVNPKWTPYEKADFGYPSPRKWWRTPRPVSAALPPSSGKIPGDGAHGRHHRVGPQPHPRMQAALGTPGQLLLKRDDELPIAGSVKARGGIYEVLKHTEDLALAAGLITLESDYSELLRHRDFFRRYKVQVGPPATWASASA